MDSMAELSERIGGMVEVLQDHGKILHRVDKHTAEVYSNFRRVRLVAYAALMVSCVALLTACSTAYVVAASPHDLSARVE